MNPLIALAQSILAQRRLRCASGSAVELVEVGRSHDFLHIPKTRLTSTWRQANAPGAGGRYEARRVLHSGQHLKAGHDQSAPRINRLQMDNSSYQDAVCAMRT